MAAPAPAPPPVSGVPNPFALINASVSTQDAAQCPQHDEDDEDEAKGRGKDHGHGPPAIPPGQAKKH